MANQATFLLQFKADFGPANSSLNQFATNAKRAAKDVANIPPPQISGLGALQGQNLDPRQLGQAAGIQRAVATRQAAAARGILPGQDFRTPAEVRRGLDLSLVPLTNQLDRSARTQFENAEKAAYRHATRQAQHLELQAQSEGQIARITAESLPLYQRLLDDVQRVGSATTRRAAIEQRLTANSDLIAGAVTRTTESGLIIAEGLRPGSQLGMARTEEQRLRGRQSFWDSRDRRAGQASDPIIRAQQEEEAWAKRGAEIARQSASAADQRRIEEDKMWNQRKATLEAETASEIKAFQAEEKAKEREAADRKRSVDQHNKLVDARAKDAEKTDAARPENVAAKRLADAEHRRAVSSHRLALQTEAQIVAQARTNAAERINNERLRVAELRELRVNNEALQVKARRVVEERLYNDQLRKAIAAEARAQGIGGRGPLSGLFSRFGGGGFGHGGGGGLSGGIPPNMGQLLGQRALTSLSYTLPSLALFAAGGFLVSTIKEAEELDRVFARLQAQTLALSDSPQQASERFANLRDEIKRVARETGVAADQLGRDALRIQGAFQDRTIGGLSGDQLVNSNLDASARFSRVTGIDSTTINNEMLATSLAFQATYEQIANVALQLEQQLGVSSDEILNFLGDIAPVAASAGFTMEEFGTIAGVAAQASGRSVSSISEQFGRILPQIEQNRAKLLELVSTDPSLRNDEQFISQIAAGDTRDIFFELLRVFDGLNSQSKRFVEDLLGGRREAAALISTFSGADKINEILGSDVLNKDMQTLDEHFSRIDETLSQTLSRLSEQVRQLGVAILNSGLREALTTAADALLIVTRLMTEFLGLIGSVNDALGGIPAKLLAVAAVLRSIQAIMKTTAVANFVSAVSGGFAGGFGNRNNGQLSIPFGAGGGRAPLGPRIMGGINAAMAPFGGPIGVGALAYGVGYQSVSNHLNNQREIALEKMKEADDEVLKRIAADSASNWERLAAGVFGKSALTDTMAADAQRQLVKNQVAKSRPIYDAILGDSKAMRSIRDSLHQGILDGINENIKANSDFVTDALRDIASSTTEGDKEQIGDDPDAIPQLTRADLGDPAKLRKLVEEANNGNELYATILRQLTGDYKNYGDFLTQEVENRIKLIGEAEKATEAASSGVSTLEAALSQYEQGNVSASKIIAMTTAQMDTLQVAIDARRKAGQDASDLITAFNEQLSILAGVFDNIMGYQDLQATFRELDGVGTEDNLRQQADARLNLLKTQGDNMSNEQRGSIAQELMQIQRDIYEHALSQAETAEEELAIMNQGFEIPEEVRVAVIEAQLNENNEKWTTFLDGYKKIYGDVSDQILRDIIVAIILGNESAAETAADLDTKIADLRSKLSRYGGGLGTAAAVAELERLENTRRIISELSDTDNSELQALLGVYDVGNEGGSSNSDRAAAARRAAEERKKRAEERKKEAEDLAKAEAEYAKALVEGDPVRVAILAQQEADRQFATAENQAERLRAQAERIRADRQLEAALFDITQARRDLVQAQLEAAGDTVGAAQASVEAAKEDLARLEALRATGGAGDAEVINAQASLVRAETRLRDEQFQKQLDDYEFLYDTGQITRQQFINYLRGLQGALDPASKQFRDLERQIRGLEKEMGQDLQFNLPSNFTLPTLYESRRISQTPGGSAGYNDNRQVSVTMYITNGMTEQQAADFLASAVGGSRNGMTTKRY